MNIRPSILLGGISLLAGLCAVLWLSKRSPRTVTVASPTEASADASSASTERVATTVPQPQSPAVSNDVPIVFYGRLEDQAGAPVGEADILGTTVFHQGPARRTARFSTKSDAEGLFRFEAGIGETLELAPRKEGYALASTNTIAYYGPSKPEEERHHPDPNDPVIMKMWKLQGAEPLAAFETRFSLLLTQTPVYFDFVTQMLGSTNGDIKISLKRPQGIISTRDQPDWSVELETEEQGGLMEISSPDWTTTYWAPAEGYKRKQVLLVSASPPRQWSQDAHGLFFVQTRHGGVYTKLSLKVAINLNPDDPVELVLSGISNTNGSCNWEADSSAPEQQ